MVCLFKETFIIPLLYIYTITLNHYTKFQLLYYMKILQHENFTVILILGKIAFRSILISWSKEKN